MEKWREEGKAILDEIYTISLPPIRVVYEDDENVIVLAEKDCEYYDEYKNTSTYWYCDLIRFWVKNGELKHSIIDGIDLLRMFPQEQNLEVELEDELAL